MTETAPGRIVHLHRRVLDQVDELLASISDPAGAPETVTPASGWSILDHVEHMARADEASLHQLEAALERDEGPRPRLAGRAILALGWIPRGLGKAPETTRPETAGRDAVIEALAAVRARIEGLGDRLGAIAAGRGRSTHPILGGFTPSQWLRFLEVHHHHHLKIIRAIREALPNRPAA